MAHNQWQFAVVGFAESKTYPCGIQCFHRIDRAIIEAVLRLTLADERFKGPDHILGRNLLAIVPLRLGTNMKDDPGPVTGPLNGFGNQAVAGKGLVGAGDEERFYGAGTDRVTLGDERVKTVKTALGRKP